MQAILIILGINNKLGLGDLLFIFIVVWPWCGFFVVVVFLK